MAGILDANSHAGADSIADLDEWVKGRVAAAPVTTFLPADSNSRLVFQEPVDDSQNTKIFRVFETDSADIKNFKGSELNVLSVQPALDRLVDGYTRNDSVLLSVASKDTGRRFQITTSSRLFFTRRPSLCLNRRRSQSSERKAASS